MKIFKPIMEQKHDTREQWLVAALENVRDYAEGNGYTVPENLRISCGFPKGTAKAIGQIFPSKSSADETHEIFISPTLDDPVQILGVVLHEVIHAIVGLQHGHKGPFRKAATALGLEGKMTATTPSEGLAAVFGESWYPVLGKYPHAPLTYQAIKKQTTRYLKCECQDCGMVIRVTSKWLDYPGLPTCACGGEFEEV